MIPNTAPIIQLLRPATDLAVARAVHDASPIKWHQRTGINPVACEFCPSELSQQIEDKLDEILPEGAVLAPWQRKLAMEVLAAKTAELDAVVEEAEPSPALKAYLDEHELVPDAPTVSHAEMTAKQLRPLASAAGMKGARAAKKAEMVEYLAHQGCGCTG